MTTDISKPTHDLVRYYGSGRNASHARLGAVWTKENGRLSIRLDTPTEQIWLTAFPVTERQQQQAPDEFQPEH